MASEERRQIIINFIREHDGCTKTQVVEYMDGTAKGERSPIHGAMMTTRGDLDELINGEHKLVIMKKDPKNSQIHYLYLDTKTVFYKITEEITGIESMLRHHPEQEAQDNLLNLLLIRLARADKYIKNEGDKQTLNQKIINLLLKIRYKRSGLASQV
jgi:hypothetical protein